MFKIKSYNHLYEKLISDENIIEGIYNAGKGGMKRKDLKRMRENPKQYVEKVRNWIVNYKIYKHTPKTIYEGTNRKSREIIVPTLCEHIVQHCIMNILKPIFLKGMYEHSYASIPDRGLHKGKNVIMRWIKTNSRHIKYCFKMDIKKFFENIDQELLIEKLRKTIHDDRFLDIIINVIRTCDKGLPLGFYTSQWFANWYLQKLDHYIKEVLKVKYYIRYMDDIVIFYSNKRLFHKIKDSITEYLSQMKLGIKKNWQIFRFHTTKNKGRALDFLGFKFYRNKVVLRKTILLRIKRKANKIKDKKILTIYDSRQMLVYIGWLQHTNSYNVYLKYIKPFIHIKKLKNIISYYDRRDLNVGNSSQ